MLWVFVFGGIALAGLAMLISYAVWLAHKSADVLSEVAVLGERAGQLGDLLAQIQVPDPGGSDLRFTDPRHSRITVDSDLDDEHDD